MCVKGAVAFALALTMSTGSSDILQSTTLLIVLFSTLVVGGIIPLFGMWVGIKSEAGRAA
jgi:NhaP-type Na+/H+ or K+/H+ antiporter